jgi:tetratricopeptide (TPR) repeat protein
LRRRWIAVPLLRHHDLAALVRKRAEASRPAPMRDERRERFRALASVFGLLIAALALYRPALEGDFVWDDDANVTSNALLRGEDQLRRIWSGAEGYQYYPLTFTSYWLQRELLDLEARTCHLVNIALHGLNAGLLFLLLRELGLRGALLAAAFFAVHPVCVESVAWITERKNVLAGFFFLLSLIGFVRYDRSTSRAWYAVSLIAFALSALSKTHAVMLPALLALLLWWRRSWSSRKLLGLLPFFALALALALVTIRFEQAHVLRDSAGAEWRSSLFAKLAVAGWIVWFYAWKVVFPHPLVFIYPRWDVAAAGLLAWLPSAALCALAAVLLARRSGPGRHALFVLCAFVVALSPVLGFIDVYFMRYAYVQDHFQYFACMALIAGLVCGAAGVLKTDQAGRIGLGLALAVLALLCALTWRQQRDYRDLETLWTRTIEKNPRAWMALTNLGILRSDEGDLEGAIALHRRALAAGGSYAEPHNNLAFALEAQGALEESLEHYRRAIAIEPFDPVSHFNCGNVLVRLGRPDEAVAAYRRALELNRAYPHALTNLGTALAQLGQIEAAVEQWRACLQLEPTFSDAYRNLNDFLRGLPAPEQAVVEAERLCRATPRENPALLNLLASAYLAAGRRSDASEAIGRALRCIEGVEGPESIRGSWLAEQTRSRAAALERQR